MHLAHLVQRHLASLALVCWCVGVLVKKCRACTAHMTGQAGVALKCCMPGLVAFLNDEASLTFCRRAVLISLNGNTILIQHIFRVVIALANCVVACFVFVIVSKDMCLCFPVSQRLWRKVL